MRATVATFDPALARGTVQLESGETLSFDVSVCTGLPTVGEVVEVEAGVGRFTGKPLVQKLVVPEEPEVHSLPLARALSSLQALGFLRAWNLKRLRQEFRARDGAPPSASADHTDAMDFLMLYQGVEPAAARAEGWLRWDWRFLNDTANPVADLTSLAGAPGLLRQDGWEGERLNVEDAQGTRHTLDLSGGLLPLLLHLNQSLAAAGQDTRLFSLDTEGDWYLIAARPSGWAAEVQRSGVLRAPEAGSR